MLKSVAAFLSLAPGILALGACVASSAEPGPEEGGCARDVLAPYLANVTGYTLAAFETGEGGARMILVGEGEPHWLLLTVALEGSNVHTFLVARGQAGSSEPPGTVDQQLAPAWDRLSSDPKAQGCAALNVSTPPVAEDAYKRMDELFRQTESSKPAETGLPWGLLVAVFLTLVAAAAGGMVLAIRRRSAIAAANPAPEAEPKP